MSETALTQAVAALMADAPRSPKKKSEYAASLKKKSKYAAHVDNEQLRKDMDARRRRNSQSWSAVGEELGMSRAVISRIKNGERKVTLDQFATIVNWLGVAADDYIVKERR